MWQERHQAKIADRSTITRAIGEVRPLLAERGCTVSPDVRLRSLAEVVDHLGASGPFPGSDGPPRHDERLRRLTVRRMRHRDHRCGGDVGVGQASAGVKWLRGPRARTVLPSRSSSRISREPPLLSGSRGSPTGSTAIACLFAGRLLRGHRHAVGRRGRSLPVPAEPVDMGGRGGRRLGASDCRACAMPCHPVHRPLDGEVSVVDDVGGNPRHICDRPPEPVIMTASAQPTTARRAHPPAVHGRAEPGAQP